MWHSLVDREDADDADAPVFHDQHGRPFNPGSLRQQIKDIADRARVKDAYKDRIGSADRFQPGEPGKTSKPHCPGFQANRIELRSQPESHYSLDLKSRLFGRGYRCFLKLIPGCQKIHGNRLCIIPGNSGSSRLALKALTFSASDQRMNWFSEMPCCFANASASFFSSNGKLTAYLPVPGSLQLLPFITSYVMSSRHAYNCVHVAIDKRNLD